MNDYNLNYMATLERERAMWRNKYLHLLEQTKRLFFAFTITMLIAVCAIASLIWLQLHVN